MRTFFFLLIVFVVLLLNVYVISRLASTAPRVVAVRFAVWAFGVLSVLSFLSGFFLRRWLSGDFGTVWMNMGYTWLIAMVYFLLIYIVLDLTKWLTGWSYRQNWWVFGAVIGLVAVVLIGGHLTYLHKKRASLTVSTQKSEATSLRLVAISDLHLGYTIRRDELAGWIELINNESPDVVVIMGDLVDRSIEPVNAERMWEVFRQLKAPLGVYAVPGNHDYFAGIRQVTAFAQKAGIHLLRDTAVLVDDRFYLVGRDDYQNRNRVPELQTLLNGLNTDKPIIVLDHEPYHLEQLMGTPVDLQLSGHTHKGQVWPLSWIVDAMYENAYGPLRKDRTTVYVSSGIGLWGGKFRIGTRSEYVVVDIH